MPNTDIARALATIADLMEQEVRQRRPDEADFPGSAAFRIAHEVTRRLFTNKVVAAIEDLVDVSRGQLRTYQGDRNDLVAALRETAELIDADALTVTEADALHAELRMVREFMGHLLVPEGYQGDPDASMRSLLLNLQNVMNRKNLQIKRLKQELHEARSEGHERQVYPVKARKS